MTNVYGSANINKELIKYHHVHFLPQSTMRNCMKLSTFSFVCPEFSASCFNRFIPLTTTVHEPASDTKEYNIITVHLQLLSGTEVVLNLIGVLLSNSDTLTMKPIVAITALNHEAFFTPSANAINTFLLTIYLTILVALLCSCLSSPFLLNLSSSLTYTHMVFSARFSTLRAEPPFVFLFIEEEKSRLCPNRVNSLKPPQPELLD